MAALGLLALALAAGLPACPVLAASSWSQVYSLPVIPVSAALLHTNQLVVWVRICAWPGSQLSKQQ